MRILHVITGLDQGGAEAVLWRLIGATKSCRHSIVSLLDEGLYGPRLLVVGCEVVPLCMPRGGLTWQGLAKLARHIRSYKPDVVQTWMYHADLVGGLAARLTGFNRVVWGIHSSELDPQRVSLTTRAVVRACALLARWLPRRIVICSCRAQDVHAALGYDAGKFVWIPNGYPVDDFAVDGNLRQQFRAELGLNDATPLVGMVARWDPQKDHANFLAAADRLREDVPGIRFVLVGTGLSASNSELAGLLNRHSGLKDRLFLLGPRSDIPRVMNGLDLHVLSSSYGEAFPNVVCEAMACGTPCVVTDVGDAAAMVGNTGWVVPPHDSAALAGAIRTALFEGGEARSQRKAAARERVVTHYSLELMAERYLTVWREVAESPV